MSFSINLNGHGADPDDVKEVFENTVRALRTIGGIDVGGSLAVTETVDGTTIGLALAAKDVEDVSEPADAAADENEPEAEAGDQATDVGSTDAPEEV